ncbi:hypothetical protein Q5762_23020 [Streptomyces sp. P9(2023)]|uniref:hypothetical protein n=1 Tax=Streptomyces sp. P9(2023) TaxID=3064394 RepID=UPI0028F3EA6E|nr:hypothetical protein [Streptomyces sp. P9(2023)]MDT9691165.1 hypothetical protein [Streptomyces sp. P9(2023)]
MLDTSELTAAVERFADRLRAAPQSRLQRGAAAEGLALARELALRAQRVEGGSEGEPEGPVGSAGAGRVMPDVGVFVVADQLLVAGTDLALALRTAPAGPWERELGEAVRLVRESAERSGL